jgi:hypothetical protein
MPRPRCVRPDGDQQRKAVTHRHAIGILDCGWSVQVALIAAGAALAAAAAALFAGPQAGRTPRRHRYHRLMRPPATALHACLTTGPRPWTFRQACVALKQIRQVMTTGARPGH